MLPSLSESEQLTYLIAHDEAGLHTALSIELARRVGWLRLWTALRIKEHEPDCDVVVLEQDVCGYGASGRNGGFAIGWWTVNLLLIFLTPHVAAQPETLKSMTKDEQGGLKLTPNAVEPGTFDEHLRGMKR